MPKIVAILVNLLRPLATSIPWPLFSWSIGLQSDGSLSFISGMIVCWLASVVMIARPASGSLFGALSAGSQAVLWKTKLTHSDKKFKHRSLVSRKTLCIARRCCGSSEIAAR